MTGKKWDGRSSTLENEQALGVAEYARRQADMNGCPDCGDRYHGDDYYCPKCTDEYIAQGIAPHDAKAGRVRP